MTDINSFDVIIVGGNYSGLASGMALGRALKKVLIIDGGEPCNRQTPHSHNFLTHDGDTPTEIAAQANLQVSNYTTVKFFDGLAIAGNKTENGFEILLATGERFAAEKIIFATGIKDILPGTDGFEACWGISVLHCPYCHGYEVRQEETGILGNGESGFELASLISNWTNKLTMFTNGPAALTDDQNERLKKHNIRIDEKEIRSLAHTNGYIENIVFRDGTTTNVKVIYAPVIFEQHCKIPEALGCELTEDWYLKIDAFQETTVKGVYACGDNTSRMRTVANAIGMGIATGMTVSKRMIFEHF